MSDSRKVTLIELSPYKLSDSQQFVGPTPEATLENVGDAIVVFVRSGDCASGIKRILESRGVADMEKGGEPPCCR